MIKHLLPIALLLLQFVSADACTNFLITKGASVDNHNYIFYSNDGAYAPSFPVHPAGSYKNSDSIRIFSYPNQKEGYIPRAKHEYHTIGYHINEFNVSIGETTFGGRDELHNTNEFLEYWHLMELGLQRSKTAREMIDVIAELVQEYGYGSPGESFSIADPDEIWLMEMVGKGIDNKGAVWAAVRIPDGYISAHANHARIGEIELDNPDNFKYSPDVIDFAIEKGYYHPESGENFSFCDTYDPVTPAKLRYTEMRVWDFFRRTAPLQKISTDYARGIEGAERMPLWIKPDEKLSFETIIALTRSHYDETPWDMEKGLKAGPHGNPNRSRPLTFEVDGKEASWERPISTPLTAYAFITELKTNKRKEANSVLWLGLDNTYTNIYMPFNATVNQIPQSYNNTKYDAFSWDSMWWVFNFVGNYVNLRYSDMIEDVKAKQTSIQKGIVDDFRALETSIQTINKKKRSEEYTQFGEDQSKQLLQNWTQLSNFLITKYNDGMVRDEKMRTKTVGYSDDFYRKAIEDDTERILPVWKESKENKEPRNY